MGGLGFLNLKTFNSALLTKVLWRLINEPQALWARIFHHKYFLDQNVIADTYTSPKKSSWVWNNIVRETINIREHSQWVVGNGKTIKIWEHNWCSQGIRRQTNTQTQTQTQWRFLNDLMICGSDKWTWDMQKLNYCFDQQTVINISKIDIQSDKDDALVWQLQKNGAFSTKSLYQHMIRKNHVTDTRKVDLWHKIWNLKVQPRVKAFLWKCVHAILPLNEKIGSILSYVNKICPNCGKQDETLTHLFLLCDFSIAVFNALDLNLCRVTNGQSSFHSWLINWFCSNNTANKQNLDWPEIMATVIWGIWKSRCDWTFRKTKLCVVRTANTIITMINSNRNISICRNEASTHDIQIVNGLLPARSDLFTVKIHIGTASVPHSNYYAIVLISSDHAGITTGAKSLIAVEADGEMELQAASSTINWLRELNCPKAHILCSNLKVLEAIASEISYHKSNMLRYQQNPSLNFKLCIKSLDSLNLISLSANENASTLANYCHLMSDFRVWDLQALSHILNTNQVL